MPYYDRTTSKKDLGQGMKSSLKQNDENVNFFFSLKTTVNYKVLYYQQGVINIIYFLRIKAEYWWR